MSRLVATRGDVAAVWANVARLQAARGDQELSEQSRRVAAQVRGVNAWLSSRPTTWRWTRRSTGYYEHRKVLR